MTAHARNTDPTTAQEAAASIDHALPHLEATVLDALARRGDYGATSEELAAQLGMSLVTVSPRLRPLATKGFAIDSGEKRLGSSGRKSIVWKAARREPAQRSLL